MRIGTSFYRSLTELKAAYCWEWEEALQEGRVSVGKPPIKEGERLLVDSSGRYHIEVKEQSNAQPN